MLPGLCDAVTPPSPKLPQVGAEFALVYELGPIFGVREREGLEHVGDGSPEETECDEVGSLEANGLDGCGGESSGRGVVGGEHHVAAAFEHAQFVLHRAWGAAEVGGGDDVKDRFGRRSDCEGDWPERAGAAPDAEIEREGAAYDQRVSGGARADHGDQGGNPAHRDSVRCRAWRST